LFLHPFRAVVQTYRREACTEPREGAPIAPVADQRKPTPLEGLMNDAQRLRFSDYLDGRIQSIHSQLNDFRTKRRKYELQMNDNFSWRQGAGTLGTLKSSSFDEFGNTIFDRQNDSLNIVGGFAAFMVARTVDDVYGTDPYYQVFPEGLADHVLADSIQKHSEWKLRMSTCKAAGLDAIDSAIGLGEALHKQTWVREVDIYEDRHNLLVYVQTGEAVVCSDGSNVYGPNDETGEPGDEVIPTAAIDQMTGAAVMLLQVTKDPTLMLPVETVTWQEMEVERVNVSYNNIKANIVHYGDILVPETAESLEDADFVGQRCQMRLSEIIAKYQIDDATISMFETESYDQKTEAAKPRDYIGEMEENHPRTEILDPLISLVECWVKHDPIGDRRQRRIYALYAPNQKVLVTMDYIANVTPEGKLPYTIVRAFAVKNRWYGRGYFEIYEAAQEFIDRHLNYVAHRNRFHANPIVAFDPTSLVEDEETDGDFELTPGLLLRLKSGFKMEDAFQLFQFPDLDERTWQLMQMMIQVIQVRSGITSAAQGETSNLPSTSTATGIESILQSASTLARQPMNLMKQGLEKALLYSIKLIYANMDRDEIFSYMEGDQQKVGALSMVQVQTLEMNVRLLLTRFKQRENLESAGKAIDIMKNYVLLPEGEKPSQRTLYVQAIKGLGFDNADTIVRQPITMDPVTGAPLPPGVPGGTAMPPQLPAPPAPGGEQPPQ
jgi:hypothetical protein